MDIKNNVVDITTMNTDEPQIDFSSSIISFRIPRLNARQGTPRPLPRFSPGGEILNFLSNISTAMDGASIEGAPGRVGERYMERWLRRRRDERRQREQKRIFPGSAGVRKCHRRRPEVSRRNPRFEP